MTDADRQRLAAILGMLGSEHQGERAAAALQAEAFRRKHGLVWAELIAMPPPVVTAPSPPPPPPEPPTPEPPKPEPFVWAPWTPPDLTPSAPTRPGWDFGRVFTISWMIVVFVMFVSLIRQFG